MWSVLSCRTSRKISMTREITFIELRILFLPQCGKFYCHRERRKGDVGVPGTFVAHDMSWLRLQRKEKLRMDGQIDVSYSFGRDSFVKRFFVDSPGDPAIRNGGWQFLENRRVSAWRISTGKKHPSQQNRVIYRAIQCHDADGPMLPPDILQREDRSTVPKDYQAAEYRRLFRSANSAKKDGRHYVRGCHHYNLPASCWIINPMDTHFVDIMVDTDAVGGTRNRQSVVMVRNVTKVDKDNPYTDSLDHITAHNVLFRKSKAKGSARSRSVDVGRMHAIGTAIPLNGVGTVPFAANRKVPEDVLRQLVVNLSKVGSRCFPQVYSVIRDMEQDSGLLPVEPMDGQAITDDEGGDSSDEDDDGDVDSRVAKARIALRKRVAAREKGKRSRRLGALRTVAPGGPNSDGSGNDDGGDDRIAKARIALRKRIAMLERRRRVGYTIDMSVNLGNSSHFDVHDASQGFSVWTEEVLGVGENWFLIFPNVHGVRPDGTEFRGMAVKLGHGVAISWDGRVLRHCTSISHPDGKLSGKVGEVKDSQFHNHLYGTFTAAKEKIIRTGRAVSAANYCGPSSSSGADYDAVPQAKRKRKGRRQKGRKSRRRRRVDASDAQDPMVGVVIVDSGRESDASSSGEGGNPIDGRDTGNAPDLMVGVEGGDTGNESGVGLPTSVAGRVLPVPLQQRSADVMREYERIAANDAHIDAHVHPNERERARTDRTFGHRLFRVDPRIEAQYREEQRAAVAANCTGGGDRVHERYSDVGGDYKIPRKKR